jgi:hypothetical protein
MVAQAEEIITGRLPQLCQPQAASRVAP